MRVEVKNPRWMMDMTGVWVSFQVPSPTVARGICEKLEQGIRYILDIKKFRKKRSKNANDLLWELCTQISERLAYDGLYKSKEDIYREHIKTAGVCEFVATPERAVESLMEGWGNNGIGWFAEVVDFIPGKEIDGCKKVCLYYGSSTYDTAEFSRLLGSVIQQANDMGIEVISESDRALLEGL